MIKILFKGHHGSGYVESKILGLIENFPLKLFFLTKFKFLPNENFFCICFPQKEKKKEIKKIFFFFWLKTKHFLFLARFIFSFSGENNN